LALALLFAWARRQGGLRLVHLPAWAYFSLMLVLSFSRTAYLVALAVAVLALAVLPRPWEKAQVVGTVLGLAILVLLIPGARVRTVTSGPILQSAATVHRHPKTAGTSAGRRPSHPRHPAHRLARPTGLTVFSASYLAQSAKAGRLHNLRVALHLIRHHPLGTGLGTFGSSGAKAFHTNLKGLPKNFYADDNYIVILVETGVLGTLLFVALGVSVYARIARCRARPGDKALLAALFLATTLMALTGDTWEQLSLTVYPWMALGLLVGGAEGGGAFPARAKLPT
jgi:putative inorganic carbon (HCO3(-)) transporter